MKNKENQSRRVVENRARRLITKNQILRIAAILAVLGASVLVASKAFAEDTKVKCSYKNEGTFVMICGNEEDKVQPTTEQKPVEQKPVEQKPVEKPTATPEATPVSEPTEQQPEEEIEVPVVGNVDDVDTSYVEPLGETASWYPDTVNYDNVVNYQYGNTAKYVASLTNPEEGITASDIALISIIALSCLAIVSSAVLFAGRFASNHTTSRKDFIKK